MAEWAAAPTSVALADINCSERKTKQKPDILSRPPQSGTWPRKRAITVLLKPNSKVTLTSLLSESAINHCNWERRTRNGGNGSTLNNACGVCGEWFTVKTSPETKWKLSFVALRAIIHMSAMYSVFHTATCWGKTNGKRWRRNLVCHIQGGPISFFFPFPIVSTGGTWRASAPPGELQYWVEPVSGEKSFLCL